MDAVSYCRLLVLYKSEMVQKYGQKGHLSCTWEGRGKGKGRKRTLLAIKRNILVSQLI